VDFSVTGLNPARNAPHCRHRRLATFHNLPSRSRNRAVCCQAATETIKLLNCSRSRGARPASSNRRRFTSSLRFKPAVRGKTSVGAGPRQSILGIAKILRLERISVRVEWDPCLTHCDTQPSLARRSSRSGVGRPVWRIGPVRKAASRIDGCAASCWAPLSGGRYWTGDRPGRPFGAWRGHVRSAAATSGHAVADCDHRNWRRGRAALADARARANFSCVRCTSVEPRRIGDHGARLGRVSRERRSETAARRRFDPGGRIRVVLARAGASHRRRRRAGRCVISAAPGRRPISRSRRSLELSSRSCS
jgi:hypothetical protein